MKRQAHLIIGESLYLGYIYATGLFAGMSAGLLVIGMVAMAAGSILPDLLEPATSAKHRGVFHSRRALKIVAVLFLIAVALVFAAPGIPHFPAVFGATGFFLGYAAHLLADSFTRAGLPA
jgi:membrane-bound metal-dependent hydrolase YbcI (DUF457 family)